MIFILNNFISILKEKRKRHIAQFVCFHFALFQLILTLNDQFKRDFIYLSRRCVWTVFFSSLFRNICEQLYWFAATRLHCSFWLILIFRVYWIGRALCLINLSAHLEVVYFDTRNLYRHSIFLRSPSFSKLKWLTTIGSENTNGDDTQRDKQITEKKSVPIFIVYMDDKESNV